MNAPREPSSSAQAWCRLAGVTALGFAVASLPFLGCALTFGLVSGLIVLLIPLYVVIAHGALVVIAVSLALGRSWLVAARVVGGLLSVAPALTADGLYAHAWWRCEHAPDRLACFQYLNGSPLLPIGVVLYTLLSLHVLALVLLVVHHESRLVRAA